MTRLLIAEDDVALAGFLRKGMESEGYQVRLAGDGEATIEALLSETPDLLILDLNMPRMDGLEVLRTARAAGASFPILMLTGRCEAETRLACLDQGADDCMFKPFSIQELRARCRALVRRVTRIPSAVLAMGDLSLNRMERVAERGGRRIPLTNREFALVEQLVLEGGRCVTRSTLLERVWGTHTSETNVVDVYINYLRRKLDDPGTTSLIETVRGQGYRMARVTPLPFATHHASFFATLA
jgi:DNA-binding response OmpR family regulator